MKKKLLVFVLVLLMGLSVTLPAFAADLPRVVDEADLLDPTEEEMLLSQVNEISERLQFDIVIAAVNSVDFRDPTDFTCDFYDDHQYGFGTNHDGVILLISMADRDWVITSTGFGQTAINADARAYLSDSFLSYLSSGEYYKAFSTFAFECDRIVQDAQIGRAFKPEFGWFKRILISLVISLIVAFITTSVMKGKLKTVQSERAAANYMVPNSLHITNSQERFLYFTVSRTERIQQSNSGRSGGGGSMHSSSSGKF